MVEDVVVKKFTFAISSPDDFLVLKRGRPPPLTCTFKNLIFKLWERFRESVCIVVKYFVPIGQTVAQIWRFLDLSKWRPSAILDFINSKFYQPISFIGTQYVIMRNFMAICRTVD